jgi:B12-binding domain/radical SAM domain protein
MAQADLVLLHPPSVYDFRQQSILYGPISDLIPSSPVFEMYPLGFLTMVAYLEERGFEVRVVNLALRMMNDPNFDVPAFLSRLHPLAFGIDLHWLPHAHGSIEVAKLIREIHPKIPIVFGGLSATYYHAELIQHPAVDFVLRGDSVEPALYELMVRLRAGRSPADVPNLTWKANGQIRVNPKGFVPGSLDHVDLRPARMVRMVLRYRDLQSVLPFNGWWQNPITAVFTVKGCAHECVTCGGSNSACGLLNARSGPVFRSPANLVANMTDISRLSRGPIFLVGDLRQPGELYAAEVLERLRGTRIRNQVVFELFDMPPLQYLNDIDRSVKHWSLELSPESHDEGIRRAQDETVNHSNRDMESVIAEALRLRCQRVDIFFMIGLPQQSQESVRETIGYCEHLFQISDKRLSCFISPLGPFLDPGSRGFEDPERVGYRLFARTLEQHRQLLVQSTWKRILNYETRWMTREQLVEATYEAGERLNALKLRYGRISPTRGEQVARRIRLARGLRDRLDELADRGVTEGDEIEGLRGEVRAFSESTVCDKRELFWRRHLFNFKLPAILRIALSYLAEQIARLTNRTIVLE